MNKEQQDFAWVDDLKAMFKDEFPNTELEQPRQASVQVKDKFKYNIGELVTYKGKVKKIIHRYSEGRCIMYDVTLLNGQSPLTFRESELKPYTEENKATMEEKELNLVELLKDCIGDTFFHPHYGDVELLGVDENSISVTHNDYTIVIVGFTAPTGMAYLYPDAESLKKYPFDGKIAWQEWSESRKPKRWRAKQYEKYWYLDRRFLIKDCFAGSNESFDNTNYKNGNYFRTKELAEQAAEAVRETLMKFHENIVRNERKYKSL